MTAGQTGVRTITAGQWRTELPESDTARALGELLCFFQFACGLSAGLLDVDPQDCGALEAYHRELSGLLMCLRGPEPGTSGGQM